jgi:hypothetical protein
MPLLKANNLSFCKYYHALYDIYLGVKLNLPFVQLFCTFYPQMN